MDDEEDKEEEKSPKGKGQGQGQEQEVLDDRKVVRERYKQEWEKFEV